MAFKPVLAYHMSAVFFGVAGFSEIGEVIKLTQCC